MTEAKPTAPTDETPKIDATKKDAPEAAKVEAAPVKPAVLAAPRRFAQTLMRAESRLVAVAGSALALGAMLGFGAASRDHGSANAVASLASAVESQRNDGAKIAATLARLDQTVGDLRTASEAARKDSAKGNTLNERIAQLDRSLTAKLASLAEKLDQAEREHAARMAAMTAAATAPQPARLAPAKAEPTQTGSLPEPRDAKTVEAKPVEVKQAEVRQPEPVKAAAPAKPGVLEQYALRDIFEGAAIIENRSRRLFQVMPGDMLPGAGRVEAIERQGRQWVVVTRQGVVTPQAW
ncbi:hypothetical protein [Methylobacterium persicinum]|uniref:Uncharacterized protein n=1 Tax=Methylobacterium persicinum TaxID=374426 RepID=A0ABU0HEM6_9HYPH|nr:hypothetical protein [Methylobacterium persicinum]MDQ0440778.1 hypothetical protein [Methylobacterium persicinum]GJE36675.1 hypothetical protein KHHGKMAE_0726 [Methylobacterium persicinum]